jgi:hypothetical protein
MRGESVSDGSGFCRSVGRFSWSILMAVIDQYKMQTCKKVAKPTLSKL